MSAGSIGLKAIFTADDKMSPSIKKMAGSIRELSYAGEGLSKLDHFNGGIFDKLKTGAIAGASALGLVGVAIGHNVVEAGADFEQSITNVGAVMGKNRGQIAELEKSALSLGVTTQFSASQVSEAMEMMAKKGFDAEEVLGGIPGVLNAVAASGEGMAEVSTVVGSSIRGFGLEAKDASRIADLLAYTAEKTGAGILNLGTSLSIAAPTARTLGVSIEDTAAAVGLLQKMGLDASTAGSATATMLAKISKPSKDAAQSMASMGVAFKDAKGNALPFTDILKQFVKVGDKAGGNMDRMAFFAELVGLRGDKAALALADMSKSGDFDKLAAGIKNTGGYAEKVAGIKLDTTMGSWKLLTSTVEVLEVKLFGLANTGLKGAIDKTNAWVAANGELIATKASGFITELVTDVGLLADNIDHGVKVLGNFKDGVVAAFEDSNTVKVFGFALNAVFGGPGSKDGPSIQAFILGERIGGLVFAFIGFEAIVKVTKGTVLAFEYGLKAIRGITILYEGTLALWKSTQLALNTAQQIGTANTIAFAGAMQTATIGAGEAATATTAASGAFSSLAAQAGLAAVAVGAVYAAYDQAQKLASENGGWEGVGGMLGIGTHDWGFAGADEVMNRQAREEADKRRAARGPEAAEPAAPVTPAGIAYDKLAGVPAAGAGYAQDFGFNVAAAQRAPGPYADGFVPPGMAPPPAAPPPALARPVPSAEEFHAMVAQELTVKVQAADGTTAEITQKPKGAKVNLQPSGSF